MNEQLRRFVIWVLVAAGLLSAWWSVSSVPGSPGPEVLVVAFEEQTFSCCFLPFALFFLADIIHLSRPKPPSDPEAPPE